MTRILMSAMAAAALLAGCEQENGTTDDGTAPSTTHSPSPTTPPGTSTPDRGTTATRSDADITAEIRRAITDDASMSAEARNVTIETTNGAVTLRGVVASQAESDAIEQRARAVSGVESVDNQLEVRTP